MLTRIGKIARLPDHVRHELNHRLMDGEGGPHLLAWLNNQPEVQAVLTEKFGGRPINQQNLSAWRTGAYREWSFRREMIIASIERHSRRPANRNQTEIASAQANSSNHSSTNLVALGAIIGQTPCMDIKNLNEVTPFTTKDGSEIRELLAHRNSAIRNQSLAEARLPVGGSTQEHYHVRTEEIYYITHGTGRMRIESEVREVKVGDAIAIPPGQKHKLWNTGKETLRLLCCCAPAYENDDTVITESAAGG